MDIFKGVALTSCFLGMAITIFDALYPSEKLEKQVKIIFSLIFLISITKPFFGGDISFPDIDSAVSASTDYYSSLNENTDDYFISSVENNISAALETALHEKNIYPEEIETSINISDGSSISINEVKITLCDMSLAEEAKRCIWDKTEKNVTVTVKEQPNDGANQ
ncbi:MAG: stage III sporulation protein AF [Oscillospiraceae bacterium]|nr:stage III sporulation protein AF [Oscillospiraceae bacterium]